MNSNLITYLQKLGLDEEEAIVYLFIVKSGPATVYDIAKSTGINRTTLYRRVESMELKGLVETIIEEKHVLIKAVDVDQLESLLAQRISEVDLLKKNFARFKEKLTSEYGMMQPGTKVYFYRGKEGIRQMAWHTLKADKEVVGYTYRNWTEPIGRKFEERWRDEFITRDLRLREIYSDDYIKSITKHKYDLYPRDRFQDKYLSAKVLKIDYQTDIYNDVVAYYNWYEGEIFGVEIHNQKIANMQKQMFEILWKMGEEPPKLS